MSIASNLSPKSPLVLALLLGGGLYILTRRSSAGTVALTNARTYGSGTPGGNPIAQLISSVGSLFGGGSMSAAEMAAREGGRAAVRAGDPYYGGDEGIGGMSPEIWYDYLQSDANAWQSTYGASAGEGGDPYNPFGG